MCVCVCVCVYTWVCESVHVCVCEDMFVCVYISKIKLKIKFRVVFVGSSLYIATKVL